MIQWHSSPNQQGPQILQYQKQPAHLSRFVEAKSATPSTAKQAAKQELEQ
jgi:hypothetical protein